MAMEDAVALTHHLSSALSAPEAALLACLELRRLRTARVQLQSREIGQHVYHPARAHAELRNAVMHARSPEGW